MKPDGVIEAGGLQSRRAPVDPVRSHAGGHEAHVCRVGQDHLAHHRVGNRLDRPHPHILNGGRFRRMRLVTRVELALLNLAIPGVTHRIRRDRVRPRDVRDEVLVLQPVLGHLERTGEIENLLTVLDRGHPPGGETLAVARAIDLIEDRHGRVARPDEIAVHRVAGPILDRLIGREKRLRDHMAAEDSRAPILGRRPPEKVHLNPFQRQAVGQLAGHRYVPPLEKVPRLSFQDDGRQERRLGKTPAVTPVPQTALLPLREKVAAGGGRMRGRAQSSASALRRDKSKLKGRATPHPTRCAGHLLPQGEKGG